MAELGKMREPLRSAIIAERERLNWAMGVWTTTLQKMGAAPDIAMKEGFGVQHCMELIDKILVAHKRLTELAQWDTD